MDTLIALGSGLVFAIGVIAILYVIIVGWLYFGIGGRRWKEPEWIL